MQKIITMASITLLIALSFNATSWTNHSLITYVLARSMPIVNNAKPVKAETLTSFLISNEKTLALFLEQQEQWMQSHLQHYYKRPEQVKFLHTSADTGNDDEIVKRFYHAIRINPNTLTPLYLQLMPEEKSDLKKISVKKVNIYSNVGAINKIEYVALDSGQMVRPLDILASASNEPDHGMDIGLFEKSSESVEENSGLAEDNLSIGNLYGFGQQAFGSDKVIYASQAPFHMGFYHESTMLTALVPYVKETYPEYRILLFKQLSEFAFKHGHDYWGWRFMGWGLHYIGDFSNPYHVSLMPSSGTLNMLKVGILDSMGFEQSKKELTQILSNQHVIIEDFQNIKMTKDYLANQRDTPILRALKVKPATYRSTFHYKDIVNKYAKRGFEKAEKTSRLLVQSLPAQFVNDPKFDYANSSVRAQLFKNMIKSNGEESLVIMTNVIADLLSDYSVSGKAYIYSVINNKNTLVDFNERDDYK